MSHSPSIKGSSGTLSPAVRAEAAAWVARLHSSGRPRALEAGLRRWLEADSSHKAAFEVATEAWEIGGAVPSGALPRMAAGYVRPSRVRRYLAAAAALGAVAFGSVLYLSYEKPTVSTGMGEQRMLILEDGTRVYLNTNTRLVVRQDAARRGVELESGEAMFDVAKDPQRPFVVTAGDREVVAVGTSFVVRHDPSSITVTLVEGLVTVSPIDVKSESVALRPGQRLVVTEDRQAQVDEPALEKVTAWRRGEVILDKTRLEDAAEEMNRYSAVKLVVADPAAADIRVSGIFRAGDSARFAQAVGETYHLNVRHEERRIVIQ